MRDFLKT